MRGFSVIELLVVTGILVVISSIVLSSHSKFGGAITLKNLAYDMALSVREAQTYGILVRQFGSGNFNVGYGMHFRISSPTSYILFADAVTPDGHYDGSGELVELITIGQNFTISDLCVTEGISSSEICGLQKIDAVFIRPEPDAQIRFNDGSSLSQRARIEVRSPRGDTANVLIEATGQISVQ